MKRLYAIILISIMHCTMQPMFDAKTVLIGSVTTGIAGGFSYLYSLQKKNQFIKKVETKIQESSKPLIETAAEKHRNRIKDSCCEALHDLHNLPDLNCHATHNPKIVQTTAIGNYFKERGIKKKIQNTDGTYENIENHVAKILIGNDNYHNAAGELRSQLTKHDTLKNNDYYQTHDFRNAYNITFNILVKTEIEKDPQIQRYNKYITDIKNGNLCELTQEDFQDTLVKGEGWYSTLYLHNGLKKISKGLFVASALSGIYGAYLFVKKQ